MIKIMLSIAMTTTMTIILMSMCNIISMKTILDREKMSPFECGFDPKSSSLIWSQKTKDICLC